MISSYLSTLIASPDLTYLPHQLLHFLMENSIAKRILPLPFAEIVLLQKRFHLILLVRDALLNRILLLTLLAVDFQAYNVQQFTLGSTSRVFSGLIVSNLANEAPIAMSGDCKATFYCFHYCEFNRILFAFYQLVKLNTPQK